MILELIYYNYCFKIFFLYCMYKDIQEQPILPVQVLSSPVSLLHC